MNKSGGEKLDLVFTNYPLVSYKKREVIFHTQDTPSGVFQIKSGYVRLFSIAPNGEELTLLILKPFDFYPTRWAFGDLPMKHVLEAMTKVTSWRIPKAEFLQMMRDDNQLLYEFTHRMVVRISSLYDRMNELAFGTSQTKIASILLMCAHSFGTETDGKISFDLPLTHKDIANLVGLTRETASVELKHLEREGIIRFDHHVITVLNKSRLVAKILV